MTASAWWTSFLRRFNRLDRRCGGGFFLADAIRAAYFRMASTARVLSTGGAASRAAAFVLERVLFAGALAGTGARSVVRFLRRTTRHGASGAALAFSTLGTGGVCRLRPWL